MRSNWRGAAAGALALALVTSAAARADPPAADCSDAAQIVHATPVAAGMPLLEYLTGVMVILRGSGTRVQIDGWTYARAAGGCDVDFRYSENGQPVRLRYFVDGATGDVQPLDERTRQTSGF